MTSGHLLSLKQGLPFHLERALDKIAVGLMATAGQGSAVRDVELTRGLEL